MVETAIRIDAALLGKIDALARARHWDRDRLVSDALSVYLAEQTTTPTRAQVDAAYTDDPNDTEAQSEEAAFASQRKKALSRSVRGMGEPY